MRHDPNKFGLIRGQKTDLPPRVAAVIRAHQLQSEILIAWAQLLVSATWASLYVLTPKTTGAASMIEPVALALGLYLLFSILRLVPVYRSFSRLKSPIKLSVPNSGLRRGRAKYGMPPSYSTIFPASRPWP
jgi:hypothetical protein